MSEFATRTKRDLRIFSDRVGVKTFFWKFNFWFLNLRLLSLYPKFGLNRFTRSRDSAMGLFWAGCVFYIVVEFEVDGMPPNESTKKGRKTLRGNTTKISSILRSFLKYLTKNTLGKKISCLSDNFKIFVIQPVRFLVMFKLIYF